MSGKHPLVQAVENAQLKSDIPAFAPGDTVIVQVKVKEGDRERLQAFEGVVIAKRGFFQSYRLSLMLADLHFSL